MGDTGAGRLAIAWWNTSLTRSRGEATHGNRVALVEQIVRDLVQTHDVVVLGEVDSEEHMRLKSALTTPVEPLRFSEQKRMLSAFVRTNISVEPSKVVSASHGSSKREAAWLLRCNVASNGSKNATALALDIAVVHWPSDMNSRAPELRRTLADRLSSALQNSSPPDLDMTDWHQVVLGDFNEEPFGAALVHGLLAERDRTRAQKNKKFFYNATWPKLGERDPWPNVKQRLVGSYYSPASGGTRWRIFDQVLVSGSLLQHHGWIFKEATLRFVETADLLSDKGTMKNRFDHLPLSFDLEHVARRASK